MVEEKFQTPRGTQATAMLIEVATNVGNRTSSIICSRLYKDGNTAGAIAFVVYFFIVRKVLVGRLFDGTFDIIFGHIFLLCRLHQNA